MSDATEKVQGIPAPPGAGMNFILAVAPD